MSFIRPDEHLILFDVSTLSRREITGDELRQFHGAGIDTALAYNLDWDAYVKQPDYLDRRIARFRDAGLKMILPLWCWHRSDLPESWYGRGERGTPDYTDKRREYLLSPWHDEAQALYLDTLERVKEKYTADDVQITPIYCRAGESIMPHDPRYYDSVSVQSFQEFKQANPRASRNDWIRERYMQMVTQQQAVCIDTPWREAWFSFHLPKSGRPNCGVDWFDDYIVALRDKHPGVEINHITFNYFNPAFSQLPEQIRHLQEMGLLEWAGAEYCEGLRAGNARRAIDAGLRGLVIAPMHGLTGHEKVEPWMLKEIEKAVVAWNR